MTPIARSGYFFPNKAVLDQLCALEDLMGKNGLSAVLNLSGLKGWIDHYPPDDLEKQIDFADVASIQLALEEVYGVRAGRNIARRSAWPGMEGALRQIGALDPLSEVATSARAPGEKIAIALTSLAAALSRLSDQASQVRPTESGQLFSSQPCPHCWGRKASEPVCHTIVGVIEELCGRVAGGAACTVQEIACTACGSDDCRFLIRWTAPS